MKKESTQTLTTAIVRYIKSNGGDAKLLPLPLNRLYNPKRQPGMPTIMANYQDKILFIEVKARQGGESISGSDGVSFLARNFEDFKKWYDKLK